MFENVDNVIISNLTMLGCYGNQIADATSFVIDNAHVQGIPSSNIDFGPPAFLVDRVSSFNIFDSVFSSHEASQNFSVGCSVFSIATCNVRIANSEFEHNSAYSVGEEWPLASPICAYSSNVSIESCSFSNNTGLTGGALYAKQRTTVEISESNFTSNYAERFGGALCLDSGSSLILQDCVFLENSCFSEGGAITILQAEKIQAKKSHFAYNQAIIRDQWTPGKGGVMWIKNTVAVFEDCTFVGNQANVTGTIHASENAEVSIKDCSFSRNQAHITKPDHEGAGPSALTVHESRLELDGCVFDQNSPLLPFKNATTVYIYKSQVTISDSSFTNNTGDVGGILWAENDSSITIGSDTIFANNLATDLGGVFYIDSNTFLSLESATFTGNEAETEGGAIYAFGAQVEATNTSFLNSRAPNTGAVWLSDSYANFNNCSFIGNTATHNNSGTISAVHESKVNISDCYFANNKALNPDNHDGLSGGAGATLNVNISSVHITNSTFLNNSADSGGCGYVSHNSSLYITGNTVFQDNNAKYGGVFTIRNCSQIHINTDLDLMCDNESMVIFTANYAEYGGALNIIEDSEVLIHCATFENNKACDRRKTFESCGETNSTYHRGGAILARTDSIVNLTNTAFIGNSATEKGGMLFAQFSEIMTAGYLNIKHNDAADTGVVYLTNCTATIRGTFSFVDNYQSFFIRSSEVTFEGEHASFERQSSRRRDNTDLQAEGRALSGFRSKIFLRGEMLFENNRCVTGSAMYLTEVVVEVYGDCRFVNNSVSEDGAAIDAYRSDLFFFKGTTIFENNTANRSGGAIFLGRSTIHYHSGFLFFTQNSAFKHGGAIYFQLESSLYIYKELLECEIDEKKWYCQNDSSKWLQITFSENYAEEGGALYANDFTALSCSNAQQSPTDYFHDECFIQSLAVYDSAEDWNVSSLNPNFHNLNFENNMANRSGAVLYGGLLDRCKQDKYSEIVQIKGSNKIMTGLDYFTNISGMTDVGDIASYPLRVCFCSENETVDCDMTLPDDTFVPGRRFSYKLAVVDQTGAPSTESLNISASLSSESSCLEEDESVQILPQMCSELHFTPYSEDSVNLTLTHLNNPCSDEISELVVLLNMELESGCPVGFSLSNTSLGCECDPKLNDDYVTNCNIQNYSVQRRDNVWISAPDENDKYYDSDILVHDYCPYDYCRPPNENAEIWLNLSDSNSSDTQCAFNREGQLCGCCKGNYSLTLGGSECELCNNTGLVLIIPFALAGIALVLVMMVCNLTLATGTINGPLFYANILIANRFVFFPQHKLSIPLQVFVSMLGLNLGITTCFYDGLDGLGKIFLQIAFEAYLIFLVVIVVLSGRNTRVSNFFHKYNFYPLHTLATLIVLSYEKLSRKIFSLFAFTSLNYVYNDTTIDHIWLFDTCEDSHISRQVILSIFGAVIIAAGLALNFILLFNKCIVGKCRSVYFNTFMVAFNAPFKPNHQYWVGLLLLIRNISYIVCDIFNAGKNPTDSLHFIFTLIIGLLLLKFFYAGMPSLKGFLSSLKKLISRRQEPAYEALDNEERSGIVYKNPYVDYLETSFLVNLSLLTYFTLYFREDVVKNQNNQAILFTISSAVVLITVIGILVYHTWVYTGISRLCCRRQGENGDTNTHLIEEDGRVVLRESDNGYGTSTRTPTFSEVDTKSL